MLLVGLQLSGNAIGAEKVAADPVTPPHLASRTATTQDAY